MVARSRSLDGNRFAARARAGDATGWWNLTMVARSRSLDGNRFAARARAGDATGWWG